MKSYSVLVLFCVLSILSGCKKTENQETVESYLQKQGITDAVKDSRGFYYKIVTEGAGVNPTPTSKVTIFYKGMLTNGSVFDQTGSSPATFGLNQLILGWQYGLPLIKPGGKIILYLPPELGYGDRSAGSIPTNSVLIFEIDLVSVG